MDLASLASHYPYVYSAPWPGLRSIAKALERSFHRQSCLGGREWRRRWSGPEWLLLPDVSPRRLAVAAGIADDQVGHGLEHPVEVVCGDREAVEFGRGVQEVDGVRDAIANSELDGIHVIAERLHQFPGIADHALAQSGIEVPLVHHVAPLERRVRVVANGLDLGASKADAAHVLLEVDELLHDHLELSGLVVAAHEIRHVVDLVDVPPAPADGRLQDGRAPDVVEHALPIQRRLKVAQAL